MKTYSSAELVNIGTGEDITICRVRALRCRNRRLQRGISLDSSRPDGTPRKLLDVSGLAKLGWRATTSLHDGLKGAYAAYQASAPVTAQG